MFNVERLRALAAVAKHGSVANAARALHVTPSGVSQQLGKLAQEAGHPLLERHGRTVRLTPAGHLLAARAEDMLAAMAAAETELADLHHQILGPLRIGSVASALRVLLPPALDALKCRHPRLAVTVRDGEAVDMVPLLVAGDLDMVLAESWDIRPLHLPTGLTFRRLRRESARVALSVRHPLGDRDGIDLSELASTPWASCPPGTEPYEALLQAMRRQGVEPEIRYSVGEYATQLELVRANLTAAMVPEIAQDTSLPNVRFIEVNPEMRRDIVVAWRSGSDSPAVRACLEELTGANPI